MSCEIRVAAIQMRCGQDVEANLDRAERLVRQSAQRGAQIVCLQELFAYRYFCQSEDHAFFELAQPIPGPLTDRLSQLSSDLGIVLIAGLFERRAAGVYHNSAAVLDADGSLVGIYRKMHIPDDPGYLEKFYFTPGDQGFPVFTTRFAQIGVGICWDQWFPEAARLTALGGAQILVFPTAIGWLEQDKQDFGATQLAAWQTMMRSHAIANGIFVVAPNRVGREEAIDFWGSSFICDPYGRRLATASRLSEDIVATDCDLGAIEVARTHWPFLRDRRIDAYHKLVERWIDG